MTLDSAVYIKHAAVRYLQGVPVEGFSVVVPGWEVLIDQKKEFPCDVCFDTLAVGRVEPYYFPSPTPASFGVLVISHYCNKVPYRIRFFLKLLRTGF